ncbi:MAG: GNAT family N-acetyltransferase [Sphingomonadales bacterium]|nr:GNAT family N-acetyltransferase [Sphingomonadales bacterium]MDE2568624.1 GNAT family N-acetyltransferase [Sphingomonadales bacterium]
MSAHTLDRPVWNCLNGPQAALAVWHGEAVRIDPAYGPFAAARDRSDASSSGLAALLSGQDDVLWLVEPEAWPAPPGMRVVRTAPLAQMVADHPAPDSGDDDIVVLGEADAAEMVALAHSTEPGPWGSATHRYGQFFGARENGRLIAMAGRRMRPDGRFAEVSGVCTAPSARGRGLAGRLIRRVMAGMRQDGLTPFLHSYAGNASAIRLYRSLGFEVRREMVVTMLARG